VWNGMRLSMVSVVCKAGTPMYEDHDIYNGRGTPENQSEK